MKTIPSDPIISQIVTVETDSSVAITCVAIYLMDKNCPFSFEKPVIMGRKIIYSIRFNINANDRAEYKSYEAYIRTFPELKVTITDIRNSDL